MIHEFESHTSVGLSNFGITDKKRLFEYPAVRIYQTVQVRFFQFASGFKIKEQTVSGFNQAVVMFGSEAGVFFLGVGSR